MIHKKEYKHRLSFVACFFLALFFFIGVRLYFVQIKNQKTFRSLATQQYNVDITMHPARGTIFDRSNKVPLTLNREITSAFILPMQLSEQEKTLEFIKNSYSFAYRQMQQDPPRKFIWIARKLSDEQIDEIKNHDIRDIHFLQEPQRFYPFPSTAQIIGFTNIDNDGIAGIELMYNKQLRGTPTIISIEKDARAGHFYFKKEIKHAGRPGKPVHLTIESGLQFIAAEEVQKIADRYNAQAGAALIMDPTTGEILAMVSYPFFDPNTRTKENIMYTKNIITSECYEFGSVLKPFSALAALEEEVTTLDEKIDCCGKYAYFGNFKVENWKPIGIVPFSDVVKYSSNVGIAKVAQRIGAKLFTHLQQLGFGTVTGIKFPGERKGTLAPPKKWSKSSLYAISFGYEVAATILQLGKAFSIIANGGYDINPHLIQHNHKDNNSLKKRLYRKQTIDQMKQVLESIAYRYPIEGYRVMGKTGTARLIENGTYSDKKHIYTFGGIIERGDYKRVIITFIKEPENPNLWATQVSEPLFAHIAKRMIVHDQAEHTSQA